MLKFGEFPKKHQPSYQRRKFFVDRLGSRVLHDFLAASG